MLEHGVIHLLKDAHIEESVVEEDPMSGRNIRMQLSIRERNAFAIESFRGRGERD